MRSRRIKLTGRDVVLSAEGLKPDAHLLEKYPRKGGRYVDDVEHQLRFWN